MKSPKEKQATRSQIKFPNIPCVHFTYFSKNRCRLWRTWNTNKHTFIQKKKRKTLCRLNKINLCMFYKQNTAGH